tara:strand:- start:2740 stop:3261 length:522 start_codon:yes stop_codon:yes gene_type:complete
MFFQSDAVGDRQDKDSLPLMWRADFSRAEYSPRRCVTKAFQVFDNFSESEADVSFDVFKKASNRSNCFDVLPDVGPEVSWVFCAFALPCCAEGLAGITASEKVNALSKAVCWQGFKIRPDRCRNQLSRFHLCNQVRSGEGFDLHMSDDSMFKSGKVKSSLDATVSSAEAENCV